MDMRREKVYRSIGLLRCNACDTIFRGKKVDVVRMLRNGCISYTRTCFRCPNCEGIECMTLYGKTYQDCARSLGYRSLRAFFDRLSNRSPKRYIEEWIK